MKQQTINYIRNGFHFIIGFTFLLKICNYGESYEWLSPLVATIALSVVVGTILGVAWEYGMGFLFHSDASKLDIFLTALGALFGGLTSFYFHEFTKIQTYSLCVSGIILLFEIIRIAKIKAKSLYKK